MSDHILLTPGPLTTSSRTKLAMLKDWGSWDEDFKNLTNTIRTQLLDIIDGHEHYEVILLQGSGTFSVEAAIASLVPRDGHILVLDNGAYCKRMAKLAAMMGRKVSVLSQPENAPVDMSIFEDMLLLNPEITHVGFIHCETGTGVVNSLEEVSSLCKKFSKGLIVDAMSSLGALPINCEHVRFDALISASGKCLEGVPGMGFVYARKEVLKHCEGNSHSLAMDLYEQYIYMEKTGQWRFTPPTHVQAALAEALQQFIEEGGQPARYQRYKANCVMLVEGMKKLGFSPFLKEQDISPIIVTFHALAHARFRFAAMYEAVKRRGFILYPGKLTEVDTFRIGCIGAIGIKEMEQVVDAIARYLKEMESCDES